MIMAPQELRAAIDALARDIVLRDATDLSGRSPGMHSDNFGAGLMALPAGPGELAALVRLCLKLGVAIVPHGGRTGLVGGTVSQPGQLIVSSERMTRIEKIDPTGRVAVVQAGVTLEALQQATAPYGLEPGVDIGSRGTATIGGMIATNAGGIETFRNGVMRHRVLGIEAVLPDGGILSDMAEVVKNTTGYDVKQLLIGSEGTLGFITRAVIALASRPARGETVLLALPDLASAQLVVNHLQGPAAVSLLAAEILSREYLAMNSAAHEVRLPEVVAEAPIALLLEASPATEGQSGLMTVLGEVWESFGILDGVVAGSERQRDELWHLREDTSTVGRKFNGYVSCDVSVPAARADEFVRSVQESLASVEPGLSALIFGHIADGNLHVIPQRGDYPPGLRLRVEEAVYHCVARVGGAISAEHGIGTKKREAFNRHVSAEKRAMMLAVKMAIDPLGLFNPGKILPGKVLPNSILTEPVPS